MEGGSASWIGCAGARYKFYWQGKEDVTDGVDILISKTWASQVVS